MAWTRSEGGRWCSPLDHWTAEAWAQGPRSATASLPCSRSMSRSSTAGPAGCRHRPRPGAAPRQGPQSRSAQFLGSISWLGIADDAAVGDEPETNGCAERWIGTLRWQCYGSSCKNTVDELRHALTTSSTATAPPASSDATATDTPKEACQAAQSAPAAVPDRPPRDRVLFTSELRVGAPWQDSNLHPTY